MATMFTQSQIDWYLAQARSAGVPDAFINAFLAYNPEDYHRILEAYASESSAQQSPVFQAVVAETALPSQFTGSAFGSPGIGPVPSIFLPTPSGINPLPARQTAQNYAPYQGTVGIQPSPSTSGPPGLLGYANSSDLTGVRAPGGAPLLGNLNLSGISPIMLLGIAAAAWYLWGR